MRTFLFPTKDTSIYKSYPNNNAGYDEILEVGKLEHTGDYEPVRGLIHFDLAGVLPVSASANLRLYFASATNLNSQQILYVLPASQSWDEGTSYFYQTPMNVGDGATWLSASLTALWGTAGWAVSGSGSTQLSTPSASASLLEHPLTDLVIDVTSIVSAISGSSIPNYGFVLKLDATTEQSPTNKANCKFFSSQTHTIFKPVIEIVKDDASYTTGSLKVLTSSSAQISTSGLKSHYEKGELDMVRFLVRDKYPPKVFNLGPRYKAQYALPLNTFFEIKDVSANIIVYPGDVYDRLSCDATGSYFILDTGYLYRNRVYEIHLSVFYSNSEVEYIHVGQFRVI
jgi:hypothetical protein